MRRADILGIMAAQLWEACAIVTSERGIRRLSTDERTRTVVGMADALLREAERVSPEPRDGMAMALQWEYDNLSCQHQWISDTAGTRCMLCGRQS